MTRTTPTPAPGTIPARLAVAALQLPQPIGPQTRATHARSLRHEIRSPGSILSGALASLVIAGCLYSGAELVLELLGQQPLITAPSDVLRRVSEVNEGAPAILFAAGLVAVVGTLLVGTVLVVLALRPPRNRSRHLGSERAAADAPRAMEMDVDLAVSPDTHEARSALTADVVANRFTAAKAIAQAIAYDSLRPALEPTIVIGRTGRAFDLEPAPADPRAAPQPI